MLAIALLLNIYIFIFVTDKPLGLEPSDFSDSPNINIAIDPMPNVPMKIKGDKPPVLVPGMEFKNIIAEQEEEFQVVGYGRTGSSLYIQLRLTETIDLSLKKGWGKAIELIDDRGKKYLFDSYSLPSGVQLHDKLVDLPDDFRAKQAIVAAGHKDIYLHFPEHPKKSIPSQLRIIESFQGNSPANPGHIFNDVVFTGLADEEERIPIIAASPSVKEIDISAKFENDIGVKVVVENLVVDENYLPNLSFKFLGNEGQNVVLNEVILVDQNKENYNMFHMQHEEQYTHIINNNSEENINIIFERYPETAEIIAIYFDISVEDKNSAIIINI